MIKYKSIFISDIHLGAVGCKAEQLSKFLKDNQCENLFLVGDIIDGWKLSRGWNWPQEHSDVVRRILTKAKRGTHITYIIGNHDEFLRSWLSLNLNLGNITITNEIVYNDVKDRDWLITHGDLFDQVTRHWRFVSVLGDRAYNMLLSLNGWLHFIRGKLGLGYWSLSKYIKHRTKEALNFIYKFEEHLSNHAKKHNMHGVICGHIHTPTIKIINDIVYINDGDWVETCSAVVETIDGEFQLLLLSSSGQMEIIERY